MDFDETMVEEEDFDEAVEDDAPLDDFVEEDESEEEDEEFYDEDELEIPDEDDEEEAPEEEPEPEPKSEPGWIKQRVGKAVEKAVRETEARMQAKFDAQLAPLLEKMMEDEARKLVETGEVRNLETAKELVRLRRGQGATEQPAQQNSQPRNEQGQFVSKEQIAREAAVNTRIKELTKQADKIRAKGGPDVINEFQTNEDIKRRVIDGELDFYDVAEMMSKPKRRPPSPAHSSNGATNYATANAFANMSSKQFQRMERQIDKGVRYSVK